MKTFNYTFLFALCMAVIFMLFSTCKKDLPRVTFPEITKLKADPVTKTTATITFILGGDMAGEDPIKELALFYNAEGAPEKKVIIPLGNNYILLEGLQPNTYYEYRIEVLTTQRMIDKGEPFVFEGMRFPTLSIDVEIGDEMLEIEQELTLSARGIIKEFAEVNPEDIDSIGHIWRYCMDPGQSCVRETKIEYNPDSDDISQEGIFSTTLQLADFTKDNYIIRAFVKLKEEPSRTYSKPDTFSLQSEGDFWVDISTLPSLDHELVVKAGNFEDVFSNINGIEGGVSFVRGGYAYIGLGSNGPDDYPTNFYKYDAERNSWEIDYDHDIPNFSTGRMFALSIEDRDDIYITTGCQDCEEFYDICINPDLVTKITFYNDLFCLNDNNGWIPKQASNGIFTGRFGAYSFHEGEPHSGGGMSMVYKGDKNGNGVVDPGEWIDGVNPSIPVNSIKDLGNICAEDNSTPDLGEWVDNVDREFNSREWNWSGNNNTTFDTGEWIDNGDGVFQTREWTDDGDGVFQTGEWSMMEMVFFKPESGSMMEMVFFKPESGSIMEMVYMVSATGSITL